MARPRILVTNDDGIDSVGLHRLAQAMTSVGDVVVVAPDQEYSGAGASIGALHLIEPVARKSSIDGVPEAWSVSGPPALCVIFARAGTFGDVPDFVVSGINPGANVGRSVYHSGTIGACLTGRNGSLPGLAVSQAVASFAVSGQAMAEMLVNQKWETAATVAASVAEAMWAEPTAMPGVMNLNVPNVGLEDLKGWRWAEVAGSLPEHQDTGPQFRTKAALEPIDGETDTFKIAMTWGQKAVQPEGSDDRLIEDGYATVSWISHMAALDWDTPAIDAAMNSFAPGS